MRLPFSFGEKEKKQYFLALLVRDEKVSAVIFEELAGKITVVGKCDEHFTGSLESASVDEYLEVLDKAISKAESALPENIETQKTIFGVEEHWVENGKIKKEYLVMLKKASDALGLIPIGFLVIHEAIAHLLQQEEGAPVSAILVSVGKKDMSVSLLRAGRIIETKRTKIEDDIPKITDRMLHHFTSYEVLPSRIIIVEGSDNHEELSQKFIGHAWSKSLPFLHVPQITILPKDFDAKAVLSGAAAQMGFDMLQDQEKTAETVEKDTPKIEEEIPQETLEEDFGFVKDTDVGSLPKQSKKEVIEETLSNMDTITQDAIIQEQKSPALLFSSIVNIASSTFNKIRLLILAIKLPSFNGPKLIFIPPLLIVFLLSIFLLYIFVLKATITLNVKPKIVEQTASVVFSTKNPTDLDRKNIAVQKVSVTIDGKIQVETTGKKEVGDKAKGSITIYSTLKKEQTFNKGTEVKSSNDLVFVLDETAKVASSSGASDAKTVKASVVAGDIGKEFNLPSGTKFTVATFTSSEVEAKNDTAFSGGTKKEITVVAKTDLDKATSDLSQNLEEKAKTDLKNKTPKEEAVLPIIIGTTFIKKNFDKNVNDEAESLTLTGSIEYQGLSYKNSDIEDLLKKMLEGTQSDKVFSPEDITMDLQNIKEKNDNETQADLRAKVSLLPKFDENKLAKDLVGKSFEEAHDILINLPQVENVKINLQPMLPFLPKLLPRMDKNITFLVNKE